MCEYCSAVELNDCIHSADAYEKAIEYIKCLIEKQHFILIEGNCEIGHHKNSNGCWVDDIIYHVIQCPLCGQEY